MPFLVTHKRCIPHVKPEDQEILSRQAVGTLAELVAVLNKTGSDWSLSGANAEQGGTIYLPDQTVIEVKQITEQELWNDDSLGPITPAHGHRPPLDKIIEAFNAKDRLEHLRRAINAESISMSEIAELQGLAEYIDPGDVQLLEWAGVREEVTWKDTSDLDPADPDEAAELTRRARASKPGSDGVGSGLDSNRD